MRKPILLFSLFLMSFFIEAQVVKKQRNAKKSFKVDGVCGMCKKRIETAALNTKGVKFALWDINTHYLNLILDERKASVSKVQQNILNIGHDVYLDENKKAYAVKKVYYSLDPCCRYRDEEVIKNHGGNSENSKK